MDKFAEQLVKKYPSTSETTKKSLIVAATLIGCIFAVILCTIIPTLSPLFILVAVGICYAAFYLINMMHTEYEYAVTNGELDVSKIIAKKKRYELLTVNVREFTSVTEYSEDNFTEDSNMTRYHCSDGTINHLFYADFKAENGEACRLYFSPSAELLEAMIPFLKPDIAEEVRTMVLCQRTNDSEQNESDE